MTMDMRAELNKAIEEMVSASIDNKVVQKHYIDGFMANLKTIGHLVEKAANEAVNDNGLNAIFGKAAAKPTAPVNDNEKPTVVATQPPTAAEEMLVEMVKTAIGDALSAPPPPSIAAAATRKGRSKLADSDLIDALTTRIQKPEQMVETLAKMGIKVSKGLIYQRMPSLAAALPDLIVAEGKAWRIKSKTAPDAATKVVKTAASAATPRKRKVGKVTTVAVAPEPPAPIVKPPKPVTAKPKSKASARKPKATPKKSSHNPFASCAKLMASLLTNEWKSVATLVSQARSYGWNGSPDLAARALDGLVRSGLATCQSVAGSVSYCRA